jgi:hypothetical protein
MMALGNNNLLEENVDLLLSTSIALAAPNVGSAEEGAIM